MSLYKHSNLTACFSIAIEASETCTVKTSWCVRTDSIHITIVRSKCAFVNICKFKKGIIAVKHYYYCRCKKRREKERGRIEHLINYLTSAVIAISSVSSDTDTVKGSNSVYTICKCRTVRATFSTFIDVCNIT